MASDISPSWTRTDALPGCVDEDGRPAGLPRGLLARGVFPAGNRLFYLVVKVDLEFPRPGVYRLDVTADEGLAGNVCHYAIEIRQRGQG